MTKQPLGEQRAVATPPQWGVGPMPGTDLAVEGDVTAFEGDRMKLKTIRLLTAAFASAVLAFTMACGSSSQSPSTPSPNPTPTPGPGGTSLAAPAPMSPIGGATIGDRRPTFSVKNAA